MQNFECLRKVMSCVRGACLNLPRFDVLSDNPVTASNFLTFRRVRNILPFAHEQFANTNNVLLANQPDARVVGNSKSLYADSD